MLWTPRALWQSFRPAQQAKNLLVFAPLIFSGMASDVLKIRGAFAAFIVFCLASAALYIFNDIRDRDEDRKHPVKRDRPIARGEVSVSAAASVSVVLFVLAILIAGLYSYQLLGVLGFYVMLALAYTAWLKKLIIIDVFSIAIGFVMRIVAGIIAIGAVFSPWILGAMFFIALFVAAMKREAEFSLYTSNGEASPRRVLGEYRPEFLRNISEAAATAAIVIYFIYGALEAPHAAFAATTIPAAYGMYRFLWLMRYTTPTIDDPTTVIVKDPLIRLTIVVYLTMVVALIYFIR